jgi:hypothetical protein
MTKTSAQLNDEHTLLVTALTDARRMANERGIRSYAVQAAQTGVVLGTKERHELLEAQRLLDESVDAHVRCQQLENSIAENRAALKIAQGDERREQCQSLEADFVQTRERYQAESRNLFATFKEMNRIHTMYQGMTGRALMFERDYRLDLPALRREADSELFTVGSMVRSGDLR